MNANEKAVAAVLANYQEALNQSNTDAVVSLSGREVEDRALQFLHHQSAAAAVSHRHCQ